MGVGGMFIRDPRVFVILPLLQIFFGINSLSRHLCRVSTRYEKKQQKNKQTKNKKNKNENQEGHILPILLIFAYARNSAMTVLFHKISTPEN